MINPENRRTKMTKAIVERTKEWLATHNTAVIFPRDPDTIEDIPADLLKQDLTDFGY